MGVIQFKNKLSSTQEVVLLGLLVVWDRQECMEL